jgi:hypothetical protein
MKIGINNIAAENNRPATILFITTLVGIILGSLSPLIGAITSLLAIGTITFGRILFISNKDMPDKIVLRTTLTSWALFSLAVFIPKIIQTLTQTVNYSEIYSLIFASVLVGLTLSVEAFRTKIFQGIYLPDVIAYAGNYMVIATIMNSIEYGVIYVLVAGNLNLSFSTGIAYAAIYKCAADILTIQFSCTASHLIVKYLHNAHKEKFECAPLYS